MKDEEGAFYSQEIGKPQGIIWLNAIMTHLENCMYLTIAMQTIKVRHYMTPQKSKHF